MTETVNIVKKGSEMLSRISFTDLKEGDTFFVAGRPHIAQGDAHFCGDSTYNGYLVYDLEGNSWFPNDLN